MENRIAQELNLQSKYVKKVLELLAEGSSIPFIARYRKDVTGAMDEVAIQQVQQVHKQLVELDARKNFILETIAAQGKLDDELRSKIEAAGDLNALDDLYFPYKQKRKTRAMAAREKGLQPLADLMLAQEVENPEKAAESFICEQVPDTLAALQGARDIIAEKINEDAEIRESVRNIFAKEALIKSTVAEEKIAEAQKYKDYFDFAEPISKIPSHRILALLRGFLEGNLRVSIEPDEQRMIEHIAGNIIHRESSWKSHLERAAKDSYGRLLQPAMETEFRNELKQRADEDAINVFSENLRQLLLSSPLGSKRLLAIDPGYRTGCKIVVLDENGELKKTGLIFPFENNRRADAEKTVRNLIADFNIEAIAVGDGTAGRETEKFLKDMGTQLPVFLVNEDGASIYSASETAREEFPDADITVRGAVSIGRRLMDPLAELVKIEPKSIGVGQYQHDVNQSRLKEKLDITVESCVNAVGVNLNTASRHLLGYVSGIGRTLAENIVHYRKANGNFTGRQQLLKVPRMGEKAFEQCAGFLRIRGAENPLDSSGVHPETYAVVEKMAQSLDVSVAELMGNEKLIEKLKLNDFVSDKVGKHTINDILAELRKPGLDPRSEAQHHEFADVYSINDLQAGMELPGIVTNLTRFGAFIDIGVKQDGLVHVSEVSHKYISDPGEVLKLNQKVKVKVLEVDVQRKRISLSIKQLQPAPTYKKLHSKTATQPERNLGDALAGLKAKFHK